MINALIIDSDEKILESNKQLISNYCLNVNIKETLSSLNSALVQIDQQQIKLVILHLECSDTPLFWLLNKFISREIEFIIITDQKELIYEAVKLSTTDFVLKPINPTELIETVKLSCKKIRYREALERSQLLITKLSKRLSNDDLIGIPTIEGYDFIRVYKIIRCRALERCTQIVTHENPKIISSYNLGEFKKLLEPFGFYSPHKSHLINLDYVKKYNRNGTILLSEGSVIPVARSKKNHFLQMIPHL